MRIMPEGIDLPDMRQLVHEHFEEMVAMSAPEITGALHVVRFADSSITLFGLRESGNLLACGALKDLGDGTVELKTMRVVEEARGRGIGAIMLEHLMEEATRRNYVRAYLETGSEDFFIPARRLYLSHGFVECGPFAEYKVDPHSVFMCRELTNAAGVTMAEPGASGNE
ncbi:GNAT family N-acetyltransferase [Actinomyces sp. F1_1611]